MHLIARFEKGEAVRFISHLDVQRAFVRAFARARLPVAFSEGFNPHATLSFASALALGYTSDGEWLDVKLSERAEVAPDEFMRRANAALPEGFRILETHIAPPGAPSLMASVVLARYEIEFTFETECAQLEEKLDALLARPITVTKRGKAGDKQVDLRPQIHWMGLLAQIKNYAKLGLTGQLSPSGGLNIGLLLKAMQAEFDDIFSARVHRCAIFFGSVYAFLHDKNVHLGYTEM